MLAGLASDIHLEFVSLQPETENAKRVRYRLPSYLREMDVKKYLSVCSYEIKQADTQITSEEKRAFLSPGKLTNKHKAQSHCQTVGETAIVHPGGIAVREKVEWNPGCEVQLQVVPT